MTVRVALAVLGTVERRDIYWLRGSVDKVKPTVCQVGEQTPGLAASNQRPGRTSRQQCIYLSPLLGV